MLRLWASSPAVADVTQSQTHTMPLLTTVLLSTESTFVGRSTSRSFSSWYPAQSSACRHHLPLPLQSPGVVSFLLFHLRFSATGRMCARVSAALAYSADGILWSKSHLTNGNSWFSNFWPDVPDDARRAVYAHYPMITAALCSAADERACFAITLDGIAYPTVEHFYQCGKYQGEPSIHAEICSAPSASEALSLSQLYRCSNPSPHVSMDELSRTMLIGLRCKFSQSESLRRALLSTGDRRLAELPDSRKGNVWAGESGELGRLLMQVRAEIRQELAMAQTSSRADS
jgi:predicted NAD-dependent protein-ADP-ribosyltransferase YbiA (DUF1768 family)